MSNRPIFLWWAWTLTVLSGAFWLQYSFSALALLASADITGISFVILGLYFLYMLYCGRIATKTANNQPTIKSREVGWFLSELFPAMGLIGTVIGLVFAFANVDLSTMNANDFSANIGILVTVLSGIGIALYTTAVGIITSWLTKIQLFLLELYTDEQE